MTLETAPASAVSEFGELVAKLYDAAKPVVGQDKGKRRLAVLLAQQALLAKHGVGRARSGGLIAGRTGTGKTMMAELMCAACDLPFGVANATQFTEAGYMGRDLPSMVKPLIEQAADIYDRRQRRAPFRHEPVELASTLARPEEELDAILALAQYGVVLLDEFDKWLMRVNHFTGQKEITVQAELLKMVEGSKEWIVESDEEDAPGVWFDTEHTLIICAGAFVGLTEKIERRLSGDGAPKRSHEDQGFWDQVEPADFVAMGVMPELAGRLSSHVMLRALNHNDLVNIIRASDGELDVWRQYFEACGGELALSEGDLLKLAALANETGTGARGIDFVIRSIFPDALFTVAQRGGGVVRLNEAGNTAVVL